ncbi:MAG: 5'-deoxynucleotidase, partial [Ruminococcaceae bacterium]|nr:5'-deoxynucleotidase [Oscillospiraceae bacterium]
MFSFYALISRMKNISRWALMRNSYIENVQEHSHMVAVLAHALAVIGRDIYGKSIDPDRCATAALFHDASEILTGDMPTPIKYHNKEIIRAYKELEHQASKKLLSTLPSQLHSSYKPLL